MFLLELGKLEQTFLDVLELEDLDWNALALWILCGTFVWKNMNRKKGHLAAIICASEAPRMIIRRHIAYCM
jgi:hypothetical protein